MADVLLTATAARELAQLPISIRTRIVTLFERLTRWPVVSGAKPLRGRLRGHYRLRTGDYRVRFSVNGSRVLVDRVGHRDRFYEDQDG